MSIRQKVTILYGSLFSLLIILFGLAGILGMMSNVSVFSESDLLDNIKLIAEQNDESQEKEVIQNLIVLLKKEKNFISFVNTIFFIFCIFGIILSFFVGWRISKLMLQPMKRIIKEVSELSVRDLSRRINYTGTNDEYATLAATFNGMFERLENSFIQQSNFISNASHELKTPISVIQGYINILRRWGKDDPEMLKESIDVINSETERMNSLINKLLYLARNDELTHKSVLNLNDLASEVFNDLLIARFDRELHLELSPPAIVEGDRDLIKQLMWIFVENSYKFTDKDTGCIRVSIFTDGDFACLRVTDNGAGISEEDLPHVFERLYRGKSKSKTNGQGLGLALADYIVQQHGGYCIVQSEPALRKTSFTVKFHLFKG